MKRYCPDCGNSLEKGRYSCLVCGLSLVPPWIRLWHGDQWCMTFTEADNAVTRQVFHGVFREVKGATGLLVSSYFPSDETIPLFSVKHKESGWFIESPAHTKNYVSLDNKRIDATPIEIRDGSKLEIMSGSDGLAVAAFVYQFGKN